MFLVFLAGVVTGVAIGFVVAFRIAERESVSHFAKLLEQFK